MQENSDVPFYHKEPGKNGSMARVSKRGQRNATASHGPVNYHLERRREQSSAIFGLIRQGRIALVRDKKQVRASSIECKYLRFAPPP
jgi:hypothetical protein